MSHAYLSRTPMPGRAPRAPRDGFTLVELLIVVVIVGILVTIAAPKYQQSRERAYLSMMKSDLKNLVAAEEGYFADNARYLSGTATNRGTTQAAVSGFIPSPNVQVVVTATGGTGWSAVATHSVTTKSCAIFIGVSAVAPASVDGEPDCQ